MPASLLAGPAASGAFGALPWREHILARHAWWGATLITAAPEDDTPWVGLARAMLAASPLGCPLGLLDAPEEDGGSPLVSGLAPPLRRMLAGLQALDTVRDLQPYMPPPADCAHAPLYFNPFLRAPGITIGGDGQERGLQTMRLHDTLHDRLLVRGWLHSLRDLVDARQQLHARLRDPRPDNTTTRYFGPWTSRTCSITERDSLDLLAATVQQVAPQWWAAAEAAVASAAAPSPVAAYVRGCGIDSPIAGPQHIGSPAEAAARLRACKDLAGRLGWRTHEGRTVALEGLTVSAATRLQLAPLHRKQEQRRMDLAAEAVGRSNIPLLQALAGFMATSQRLVWKVRWDNHVKEVYWRLVLNGLATAERLHKPAQQCLCRAVGPGRRHHFWDCPVAQAVVQSMEAQFVGHQALQPGEPLTPRHVLLMRPPATLAGTLHGGVWQVVCLAAVSAMDVGRKATAKWHAQRRERQQQQHQRQPAAVQPGQHPITAFFEVQPPSAAELQRRQQRQQQREEAERLAFEAERQPLLAAAKLSAVARFWELLADFVEVGAPPAKSGWLERDHPAQVPRLHPFVHAEGTGQELAFVLTPRLL